MPVIPQNVLRHFTILVVDDDAYSLQVATVVLEHYGAQVHLASSGAEGLDLARTVQSSFIISDLSMPKMDGWIMIQQLRQNPDTVHIPIIALTAHAMSKDREKALAAGFNAYITKPITPGGFIGDLLRILAGIPSLAPQLSQNDREH